MRIDFDAVFEAQLLRPTAVEPSCSCLLQSLEAEIEILSAERKRLIDLLKAADFTLAIDESIFQRRCYSHPLQSKQLTSSLAMRSKWYLNLARSRTRR